MMNPILLHNQRAWDERARKRRRHTRTATDRELGEPLRAVDPEGWLNAGIQGWRVLCLAAGGGLQSVLYAAAGAEVTVADISAAMLELDEEMARRHGFSIRCVHASMDDLSSLNDEHFDLVIQPVSTCYVPDVEPVFREVARIAKPGGLYISQHKQPVSLQTATQPDREGRYVLAEPCHQKAPLPQAPEGLMHREAGTHEFIHTWEDLLGGICRAGFAITGFSEPRLSDPGASPGSAPHRYCFAPPYLKCMARRTDTPPPNTATPPRIWIP